MVIELLDVFLTGVRSVAEHRGYSESEIGALAGEVGCVQEGESAVLIHVESGLMSAFSADEVRQTVEEDSAAQNKLYLCVCALVGAYEICGRGYADLE
ncbi:TPA: hypothetical protein RFV54_001053 [Klebsiella aerogenes]|nr:hypothetical protein [Klebsiella aerogenes]